MKSIVRAKDGAVSDLVINDYLNYFFGKSYNSLYEHLKQFLGSLLLR
jgi:hypothetical protein